MAHRTFTLPARPPLRPLGQPQAHVAAEKAAKAPKPHLPPRTKTLKQNLRETFGINHLRPGQHEVIESVLHGHHTLAVMPTGAGKSLCYQLPSLNINGATIVVSPLIALMKDQADKLESAGLEATAVNSTLRPKEQVDAWRNIRNARSDFIFTTPEQLLNPDFIAMLAQNPIGLFVIDEAHCISQWGHDFRPAYLQLGAAIAALGTPTVLALTATATDKVTADIISQLGMQNMRLINTGIYRPNLRYAVMQATSEQEKHAETLRLARQTQGSGIVYVATIKMAEELHQALADAGESVALYHGQLPTKERNNTQDRFMAGTLRLMVATNAFGMGIDKPDIRFIIHYQMPANLEAYYQESGRAGRDQQPADCTLLYYAKDKQIQNFFLARRYPSTDEVGAVYKAAQDVCRAGAACSLADLEEARPDIADGKLQVALKLLQDGELLQQDHHLGYHLIKPDASAAQLAKLAATYRDKSEHDRQALEHLVLYAQTGFCRWKVLLEYFDETVDWEHCGVCDNCQRPPEQALTPPHNRTTRAPVTRPAPDTITALHAGSTVSVPKFGEGRIVSVAGDKISIVFPNGQTRTFLREYVAHA